MSEAVTFRIEGKPKTKPLLVGASIAALGLVALLSATLLNWGGVWVGAALFVALLGLVVILVAVDSARRHSVFARLDDAGLVLLAARSRHVRTWREIKKVTLANNRLTLKQADGKSIAILAPPGSAEGGLDALAAECARRLDADRGYRKFA